VLPLVVEFDPGRTQPFKGMSGEKRANLVLQGCPGLSQIILKINTN